MSTLWQSVLTYGRMIKFAHTLFALPFALAATVLASQEHGWSWVKLFWILVCMVGARTAAMGFNRIVDRDIDAANPRTQDREIPSGRISVARAWTFTGLSAAVFVLGAWALSPLCLLLSPLVLAILLGYSLTKRFTALCHLFLGLALALSPTAAWIAIGGEVTGTALLLSAIVMTWVAGFDILYALQDADYDRDRGLNSIPAKLGIKGAMGVSIALHVGTLAALIALPFVAGLGWAYWIGFAAIAGILIWEHAILRPDDLSRMNGAFFQANSAISVLFIGTILLSLFV